MTWIKFIPREQADEPLRSLYQQLFALIPPEYGTAVPSLLKPDGTADSISAAHSLIPDAMWHMMAGFAVLTREGLGLTRRQQEMIASVVSAKNSCFY